MSTTTKPTTGDPITAVLDAERRALADHESGACRDSEWSCSHCEAAATTADPVTHGAGVIVAGFKSRLEIEGFTLWCPDDNEGRPLHFSTNDDDLLKNNSIENLGTVHVHLGEDLDHDRVTLDSGRTADLTVLDGAISSLQAIRDTLAAMTPEAAHGQCVGHCDWGRCLLAEGHAEEHQGPTEVEWQATWDAMQSARKKRTA